MFSWNPPDISPAISAWISQSIIHGFFQKFLCKDSSRTIFTVFLPRIAPGISPGIPSEMDPGIPSASYPGNSSNNPSLINPGNLSLINSAIYPDYLQEIPTGTDTSPGILPRKSLLEFTQRFIQNLFRNCLKNYSRKKLHGYSKNCFSQRFF